MFAWLESLNTLGIVFACIAFPATLILLIQIILTLIGMGDNGDADVDAGADTDGIFGADITEHDMTEFNADGALNLFTFRGIIAFLVTFGWIGLAVQAGGAPWWLCVLIGFVAGAVMMTLVAVLLRAIYRLQSDGTANVRNALGTAGVVYLTIPAKREGKGKVNLLLQGAYVELDAVTDSEEPIKTGAEVTVCAISGGSTLVVARRV